MLNDVDVGDTGADYVLHTASPFQNTVSDPQKDLVDPALKGTLNVLHAAAKSGTVKRVVVTSSCAAIAWQATPPDDKVCHTSHDTRIGVNQHTHNRCGPRRTGTRTRRWRTRPTG